jgi:hypothetical protein
LYRKLFVLALVHQKSQNINYENVMGFFTVEHSK